jgi:hypothetical protein
MIEILTVIVITANSHNIDPVVFRQVLTVESGLNMGKTMHNKNGTKDHCMGQINDVAIKEYKLDKELLIKDPIYCIESTARILADLKKRFPRTWVCRYNVGTAPLDTRRQKLCNNYLKKVRGVK